ncbi:MAG: EamA family transporter [Pseudomonadales bacterium]|nr:EamA family transporter [Pseudomonadales bacterium]
MHAIRMTDMMVTALAPIVWGSTYLITTEFLPPNSPLLASLIRALPAGLVLLLLCRKLPKGMWWGRAAILGTLNIGLFFYLLFEAAYRLPGGVAALVMACQPIVVLLLSTLLLQENIRKIQVAACGVGAAGIALLVLKPTASLDLIGIIAGLAGAVSMALGVVLTKRWGRPEGVSMLNFTGWQLTAGGLFLLPITLLFEPLPDTITGTNLMGFGYLSIIGALLAYTLWFRGIERLDPTTTSFIGFASPLSATILGYIFLQETFTPLQSLGALAILCSIVLSQAKLKPSATQNKTAAQQS